MSVPRVNIFVLNYNGRRYLPGCFDSLAAIEYPQERMNVVLVDNASADESASYVKEHYPSVIVCETGANLGFGKGNNVGVSRYPEADVYVFLNSDVTVSRDWLANGVAALASNPRIGLVSSLSVFQHRYLCLHFEASADGALELADLECRRLRIRGERLRYSGMELRETIEPSWTLARQAVLRIPLAELQPVLAADERPALSFVVRNTSEQPQTLTIRDDSRECDLVPHRQLLPKSEERFALVIEERMAADVVQNAGSLAHADGHCGDRGFLEVDHGQYAAREDVAAACGVAMFVRRAAFEELGGFDERYFMYYEDTDLSLRARARGWRVIFEPTAKVRHIHTGSSVEWSPFFRYQVARSQLIYAAKFLPTKVAARVWGHHARAAIREYCRFIFRPSLKRAPSLHAWLDIACELGFAKLLRARSAHAGKAQRLLTRPEAAESAAPATRARA